MVYIRQSTVPTCIDMKVGKEPGPGMSRERSYSEPDRLKRKQATASLQRDWFKGLIEEVSWAPDLEVLACGNDVVVRATLHGIQLEDLRVQLDDGVLCITGERHAENRDEYGFDSFIRRLTLPTELREEDVRANFGQGVLEISFPAAQI